MFRFSTVIFLRRNTHLPRQARDKHRLPKMALKTGCVVFCRACAVLEDTYEGEYRRLDGARRVIKPSQPLLLLHPILLQVPLSGPGSSRVVACPTKLQLAPFLAALSRGNVELSLSWISWLFSVLLQQGCGGQDCNPRRRHGRHNGCEKTPFCNKCAVFLRCLVVSF